MTINEILDKLEQGNYDHPNQKGNLFLQVSQYIKQLEIADRNNQNLVKTNVELVNKNFKLQEENQALRDKLNSQDLDIWQLHCKYAEYKKVIDILKDKKVNIACLLNSSEHAVYNFYAKRQCLKQLTQQEYDLLKEFLG